MSWLLAADILRSCVALGALGALLLIEGRNAKLRRALGSCRTSLGASQDVCNAQARALRSADVKVQALGTELARYRSRLPASDRLTRVMPKE